MQDYQKCRICLVAENQVKLFSMFAKQGEDVKNYERLSNITVGEVFRKFSNLLEKKSYFLLHSFQTQICRL